MKLPNLFPRNDTFYHFLEKQAQQALDSAQQMKMYLAVEDKRPASTEIDKIRADAKTLASDITSALCRSFVTPFDREDIQDFADLMYKIPKTIQHTKERIAMHEIADPEGGFAPQTDLIVQSALEMQKLIAALTGGKGSAGIIRAIGHLRELEQKGDHIKNEMLVELFKSDRDIRRIMLRRDIHDMLEAVLDHFRDAAAVALQIVLKHS